MIQRPPPCSVSTASIGAVAATLGAAAVVCSGSFALGLLEASVRKRCRTSLSWYDPLVRRSFRHSLPTLGHQWSLSLRLKLPAANLLLAFSVEGIGPAGANLCSASPKRQAPLRLLSRQPPKQDPAPAAVYRHSVHLR